MIAVWEGGLQFAGGFIAAIAVGLPTFLSWERLQRWQLLDVRERLRRELAVVADEIIDRYPGSADVIERAAAEARRLAVIELAAATRTPVTPVGANSSLEGHTVPVNGGISLDLSRMDEIKEVSVGDLLAVVQPGVIYQRLNQSLRQTGLYFPVDPGAEATLGGMASTNASGTQTVRYGSMRDQLYGLEVVLADGRVRSVVEGESSAPAPPRKPRPRRPSTPAADAEPNLFG